MSTRKNRKSGGSGPPSIHRAKPTNAPRTWDNYQREFLRLYRSADKKAIDRKVT